MDTHGGGERGGGMNIYGVYVPPHTLVLTVVGMFIGGLIGRSLYVPSEERLGSRRRRRSLTIRQGLANAKLHLSEFAYDLRHGSLQAWMVLGFAAVAVVVIVYAARLILEG